MSSVVESKNKIKTNLNSVKSDLNAYLRGESVEEIRVILKRLGRGGKLPHWYSLLEQGKSMPNLDGKTIPYQIYKQILFPISTFAIIEELASRKFEDSNMTTP